MKDNVIFVHIEDVATGIAMQDLAADIQEAITGHEQVFFYGSYSSYYEEDALIISTKEMRQEEVDKYVFDYMNFIYEPNKEEE